MKDLRTLVWAGDETEAGLTPGFFVVDGSPDGVLEASSASIAINPTTGVAYIKTDTSATSWSVIGTSGGAVWGAITGTLSNQTDLQTVLDEKLTEAEADTLYDALGAAAAAQAASDPLGAAAAAQSASQPLNSKLTAYAGGDTPSAFTLGIVDSADAATWRTALSAQTLNTNLTAYAGGDLPSAFTLGIVDSADAATWRTAIGAGTSSAVGANPSVSIGLAAINGSAGTFLRSDGAPALDQGIAPTWSAEHIFGLAYTTGAPAIALKSTIPAIEWWDTDGASNAKRWMMFANSGDFATRLVADDGTLGTDLLRATRSGNALTVVNLGNATDNPAFNFLGTGLMTLGGPILFAAGSASANTWPKMTPGTLLTTAENGALELDTKSFYVTTIAGNRGVVPNYHLIRQNATYTLANQGTAQKAFDASTNGRLTLGTGTYLFEALISLSGMSATSGNALFSILGAGGATIGSVLYLASGIDSAAGSAGAGGFSGNISSSTPASAVPAGIATALQLMCRGTFEITVAGTIVPSLTLVTAVGTVVVAIGSYFFCTRVGSDTLTTVGAWD